MVWVERFLALQVGFVHPSVVRVANAVLEELVLPVTLPIIIPWAKRVDMMSAEEVIAYKEGITGSHFGVGGMDRIITPLQVSSFIAEVLRLSTAAFRVRSNLIWSWISAPSA